MPLARLQEINAQNTSTPLPSYFQPGEHDVICSRGRNAYNHTGNKNLREVINFHTEQYSQSLSRAEKSILIISVVGIIRSRSPEGGFVKFCPKNKCYFEIGDVRAREKVGHSFREAVSSGTHLSRAKTSSSSWTPKCEKSIRNKSSAAAMKNTNHNKLHEPLPYTAPQQTGLLEMFAAEFNFDRRCSLDKHSTVLDIDSSEFRLVLAEESDDMGQMFDDLLEKCDLLDSLY